MVGQHRKLISIIIPALNESEVLGELCARLTRLMSRQEGYDFEVILIENGSSDDSWEKMLAMRERDPRFKLIQLTRNFMADGALMAGFEVARGDAAIMMDADLQDPPELIDKFLERWERGAEVVFGEIRRRENVGFSKKLLSNIYFGLLNRVTRGAIPRNASGFRLLDNKSYVALKRLTEHNRFTRGLSTWSGFRQEIIEFDRPGRFAGESKAPFRELLKEGWDGIYAFSNLPAQLPSYIGISELLAAGLILVAQIVSVSFGDGDWSSNWLLAALMLTLVGLLSCSLGLMGGFIWRIVDEVRDRPTYVVRQLKGFEPD